MNEKVKIREPRHTLAQPLSLEEERFVSFIKPTDVVSTKGIVIFPVGIFGDLSHEINGNISIYSPRLREKCG